MSEAIKSLFCKSRLRGIGINDKQNCADYIKWKRNREVSPVRILIRLSVLMFDLQN
jgi:hypothetical protein